MRLGWSRAQVEQAWGSVHGRCRACAERTWYFNARPFDPAGAGVTFRRGRVVAVFTLWAPARWHTSRNVYVGEPEHRVRTAHGPFRRVTCAGYDGLVLRGTPAARSVVYVVDGAVWGFGLLGRGTAVCR